MALTKEDLKSIESIMDQKLSPVKKDLSQLKSDVTKLGADVQVIKDQLDRIEPWLQTDNSFAVPPLKKSKSH